MEVFSFDKNVMERYEECCMALKFSDSILSASKIHSSWQYYLSVLLEPAGWTALWRLNRVFCEELQIRYPTVVYGTVEQIDFKECKAQFKVEAVPDADINLVMETHFVNLEELWPTMRQENDALNVEKTAEALDNYRFFLNNIWQPWDQDDDESIDFIDSHFLSRAQLYCDMKNKKMDRNSIARLKMLIKEAREISLKIDRLESEFVSDDEDEEHEAMSSPASDRKVTGKSDRKELLRLNMRMSQIKTEFEILENPKMRQVHEEAREEMARGEKALRVHTVIVTKPGTVNDQIEYLSAVKLVLGKDENVVVRPSLQDALLNASPSDTIFIPHTLQPVEFPLALEDGGCIKAIKDNHLKAIISAKAEDQQLFICGNYQFENLTLDCRNVDIGVVVRSGGSVTLKNCEIIGGKQASTHQGICVRDGGKLILENCTFEDNSTGISARSGSEVFLKACRFNSCTTGLDVSEHCQVTLEDVTFDRVEGKFGMVLESAKLPENKIRQVFEDFGSLPSLPGLHLSGVNKGSVCLISGFIDDSNIIMD